MPKSSRSSYVRAIRRGHGKDAFFRARAARTAGKKSKSPVTAFLPRGMACPAFLRKKSISRGRFASRPVREMRHWQKSPYILLPKGAFMKAVKKIMDDVSYSSTHRTTNDAKLALGEASQAFLHQLMRYADTFRRHAGRQTLMKDDVKLAKKILMDRLAGVYEN